MCFVSVWLFLQFYLVQSPVHVSHGSAYSEARARIEAARARLGGAPADPKVRKALKVAEKYLNRRRIAAVSSFIEKHAARLERNRREGDHAGFYELVKGLGVKGRRPLASQNIKDADANLLRDPTLTLE